jgi:protease-4
MSEQPKSEPSFIPSAPEATAAAGHGAANNGNPDPGWERAALERIALAALYEQRAARRWKIFFRLIFLGLFALLVWGILNIGKPVPPLGGDGRHTALVKLDGEIDADGSTSANNVNDALDKAFEDKNTAGVILEINSPGGSPVQAGRIYDEIVRLRKKYPGTKLYAVVDDMCASGGYYVAAAADEIYVNRASLVGSIGVRMGGFGFTGLMEKLGIERRLYTAGENKALFDPFAPVASNAKQYAGEMLNQLHAQFIDAVKRGRGNRLKDKDNPEIFSGLVWTGQRSVELGLADGFGDTAYVARDVINAKTVVDYTEKENFTDRIARRLGASMGETAVQALLSSGLRLR